MRTWNTPEQVVARSDLLKRAGSPPPKLEGPATPQQAQLVWLYQQTTASEGSSFGSGDGASSSWSPSPVPPLPLSERKPAIPGSQPRKSWPTRTSGSPRRSGIGSGVFGSGIGSAILSLRRTSKGEPEPSRASPRAPRRSAAEFIDSDSEETSNISTSSAGAPDCSSFSSFVSY